MSHLALFGHVNIDWIMRLPEPPQTDGTVEIIDRELRFGGTAGNIAAVAAKLGAAVKLTSFIGRDFPDAYRVHLETLGVDCSQLIKMDAYGTPTWWGLIHPDHRVTGILDQGPFRDLETFEPRLEALEGAATAHFSTGRPGHWKRVAQAARQQGLEVLLDPGQELRALYSPNVLEDMLELSDLFIVNHHEMDQALEKLGYGEPVQLFDHNLQAIIKTAGDKGAWLYTEKETVHIPTVPVPPGEVVDTTGAGDAFRGAFHAARQDGKDLVTACTWGAVAASIIVRHVGGQTYLPDRAEVERIVEGLE